ncbi:sigma-70 family RNA polymerase sigma factor [Streptomyces sp. IBSNAI001]|uniref:sigma-70 family RNA polymerase sigma factor n=1 Tax=Streptomyces sp. IBSNAI001 TaxID=3457499 RepID=UPI003FCFD89E
MATVTAVTDAQILAAQGGDQMAMWEIVSAYDPMIRSVIRSAASAAQGEDVDDLLQEGRIVLIQHVRQYDTDASSASLSSYAYRAIHRAIAEEWIRMSNAFKVDPTKVIRVRRALWEADGSVEGAWNTVSNEGDPSHRMSREAFVSVCEALAETDSLEAPLPSGDGGATLADTVPDTSVDVAAGAERKALAHYLLREIPQRQAYALRAYYGIGMAEMTDHEAADDMTVNLLTLRKLRSRGLDSARTVSRSHGLAA